MTVKKNNDTANCKRSTVSLFMEYCFDKSYEPDIKVTTE